jgi:hypothetical protein
MQWLVFGGGIQRNKGGCIGLFGGKSVFQIIGEGWVSETYTPSI